MSEPIASGANPAATAAALPPLDPPGTKSKSCGLRVGPKAEFSVELPIANSSQFVFPIIMAPASFSLVTTVASYGGSQPSRILEQAVVATPFVQRLSLTATGTPANGPTVSPFAIALSMLIASAFACCSVTRVKAFTSPSWDVI